MQLSGEGGTKKKIHSNSFTAGMNIIKSEGFLNLYTGLSAALFRQATYTTTRWGVYNWTLDYLTPKEKGKQISFLGKLIAGATGGGVGALVGVPAEVALIRMTADGRLPPENRRNYKHVFNALSRIINEEGITKLWRGCLPTIMRAIVLNAAQLAFYSQAKQMLLDRKYLNDNIYLHLVSSLISGFAATTVSLPIDITKTRIQTMKPGEYSGALDVLRKTIAKEGVFSLWKGFTPYYLKLGPHTILTFIFLEKMSQFYISSKYPSK